MEFWSFLEGYTMSTFENGEVGKNVKEDTCEWTTYFDNALNLKFKKTSYIRSSLVDNVVVIPT